MPVAINVPQKRQQADPLEKLATALQIAKIGFGIASDMKIVEEAKATKAEEKKLREAQLKKLEREEAEVVASEVMNTPLIEAARAQAKLKGISLPAQISEKQLKGMGILDDLYKPAPAKDPVAQELAAQRLADAKQKRADEAAKRSPKGRLAGMPSGDRGRFDNVVMALDSLTGMDQALSKGDNTIRLPLTGDNNFTRNKSKWREAIGRMQSGGAIGEQEAKDFLSLVPGPADSKEQQLAKLKDMRVLMEQRFGSFGFDKSQAGELGLDPVRLGWQQPPQDSGAQGLGLAAGSGALPKPKTVKQNGHTFTLNPKTGEYESVD